MKSNTMHKIKTHKSSFMFTLLHANKSTEILPFKFELVQK